MKKYVIGFCLMITIILATLGIMYGIDMNRMKSNKPTVFSNWGHKYIENEFNQPNINFNGGVVIGNGFVKNISKLDDFIENTSIYSNNRHSDSVTIFCATIEGDYIVKTLKYNDNGEYELKVDTSFDRYGSKEITTTTYNGKTYGIKEVKEDGICIVKIAPSELIEFSEIPEEVIVCSYKLDDVKESENSFIGTVLEETTTYMLVEPNEDEPERKIADKFIIEYGTEHNDYFYGVGRKVLINYSGYVLETYPAKIKTNNIGTNGYNDFELIVKNSDKAEKRKILNNIELYKYNSNYNLYYYGLDEVNVNVNNETMSLEEALKTGKLTIDGIIAKANMDNVKSDMYKDGGSMIYWYDDYTIIKCHFLDGNRDVYIGSKDMTMNKI